MSALHRTLRAQGTCFLPCLIAVVYRISYVVIMFIITSGASNAAQHTCRMHPSFWFLHDETNSSHCGPSFGRGSKLAVAVGQRDDHLWKQLPLMPFIERGRTAGGRLSDI